MKTHSVQSTGKTNIQQIDFDDLSDVLLVRFYDFKNGKSVVYEYSNVPVTVYDQLVKVDLDNVETNSGDVLEKEYNKLVKDGGFESSEIHY